MRLTLSILATLAIALPAIADPLSEVSGVEGQPLGQNADRVAKALDFLGKSLPADVQKQLAAAIEARDAKKIQQVLDPQVLLQVTLSPESRVKVARGPAAAVAQQSGWTPAIVKVVNESTVKKPLRASSPQAGPVQSQRTVKKDFSSRFLELEMFTAPPLTKALSGLKVEYAILLIYSSEAGKREATIGFDVGQGTQDLGFRGEAPVLFEIKPAIPVKIHVRDEKGQPTVGRFTFTDAAGHVYPPRAKRLAPDFFFQNQVYREDGGTVLLPPGEFTVQYGRGPEYLLKARKIKVSEHRCQARRRPRALGRSRPVRLVQRRPSHPRGRLRPLHEPDRRGLSARHVPPRQGRGAERRLLPHVGPVLRISADVFRARAQQAERAVHVAQVRHRGQRLRLAGARPRLLAQPCAMKLIPARREPRPRAGRPGRRPSCVGPSSRAASPATLTRRTG